MSETPGDAPLEEFLREEIPRLAILYDRLAHALDPFDPVVDVAEQTFNSEVRSWFDLLPSPEAWLPRLSPQRDRALPCPSAGERQIEFSLNRLYSLLPESGKSAQIKYENVSSFCSADSRSYNY
jgi:hypothetical protein